MRRLHSYCFFIRLLAILLFFALPAQASPRDDLKATQGELAQSRQRQEELARQNRKLEAELKDIQHRLVRVGEAIQKAESALTAAEDRLAIIAAQRDEKKAALAEDRKRLEALVDTALRLSRMPPEAMVMMPGDMEKTMQASRALKMVSDETRAETERLGVQMRELGKLEQKVKKRKEEVAGRRQQLEEDQRDLAGKLADRKALQQKLGGEQKKEAARAAKLARKTASLRGLIEKLDQEAAEREEEHKAHRTPRFSGLFERAEKGRLRSFAHAKGDIRIPVAGKVETRFGAAQKNGGNAKGVTLSTREDAQVVAPYDGEVVFAGPFLNYGRMVILRHSDDFHTLLAGLSRLDVSPGEFLLEGEPIGAMGDRESQTRLYMEMRKHNQPVNPAVWVDGL